jgi:hypothetical protein
MIAVARSVLGIFTVAVAYIITDAYQGGRAAKVQQTENKLT